MKLVDLNDLKDVFHKKKIALTIGNFDGVHSGHKFLLDNFIQYSNQRDLVPVVITFSPHPAVFLSKNQNYLLTLNVEKIKYLREIGIENLYIINFNDEIRQMKGEDFIYKLLDHLKHVDTIYVGHDFSLGANKSFSFNDLNTRFNGIVNCFQEKQFEIENEEVSSSRIRKALITNELKIANKLLEEAYRLKGKVIAGNQIGGKLGFPTANMSIDQDKLIPGCGVYAGNAIIDSHWYKAAINIGKRPTVDSTEKIVVEVHILDFSDDLYNSEIEIVFYDFIRSEKKFETKNDLVNQIKKDVEAIRNLDMKFSFALVGKNITKSRSPRVYKNLLQGKPIEAKLLDIDDVSKVKIVETLKKYQHVCITAPFKKTVFDMCKTDTLTQSLMAVNAIQLVKNELIGTNTDYLACKDLLMEYSSDRISNYLVIGDGAMSKVITEILNELNCKYDVFSRKLKNLDNIGQRINESNKHELMVINTCSKDYVYPITTDGEYIFWDLNYDVIEHQQLFFGKEVKYIDGLELLFEQARHALSFWNCRIS